MSTRIFCDIAEINQIKSQQKKLLKVLQPILMRKAERKIIVNIQKILKVCNNKPISFEVFADNYEDMINQAKK